MDIEVTPNGLSDAVPRLEFSGGHSFSFTLRNYGTIGGPDARVTFSCGGSGITVTTCPGQVFVPPADAQDPLGAVNVTLVATMGLAQAGMTVTLTAFAEASVGGSTYADTAAGWWDLTAVKPGVATLVGSPTAFTMARGAPANAVLTLTNSGELPTAFSFDDVAGCSGVLSSCSRTPSTTGVLPVNGSSNVTYAWTAAAAGLVTLQAVAMHGARLVASLPLMITIVDASATANPTGLALPQGAAGHAYTGFTVTNAPGGPPATYQLTLVSTGGVGARFSENASSNTSVSLGPATPATSPTVLLDAPPSGTGSVRLDVSFNGTLLSSATLAVAAITGNIVPGAATTSATLGNIGVTYTGFSIVGTPNVAFTAEVNGTCAGVTNCRFSNGASSMVVNSGSTGTVALPVVYDAPTVGAGSFPLRLRYSGSTLSTATLAINVNTTVSITGPASDVLVVANQPSQSIAFQVTNGGGPVANVTFSHNCGALPSPVAALTCTLSPAAVTSLATGSTALTLTYTSGAPLGSSTVVVTATAGTALATGSVNIRVPSATVTAPGPVTATMGTAALPLDFQLLNNGPGAITYYRTVSCSAILAPCGYNGQSPVVQQGQSSAAPATFTPTALGSGSVTLEVRLNSATGPIVATGVANVTVQSALAGLTVTTMNLTADSLLYRDQCLSLSLGSSAASECGDLRIVHPLPSVRALNVTRTPTLTYNSNHARPYPVVPANLTLQSGAAIPTLVSAVLKVSGVPRASASWPGSQWSAGSTRRVALGFNADSAGLATGVSVCARGDDQLGRAVGAHDGHR
ncbi:MAG: hypothetical protein IPK85_24205 [Gemmatimonadetes bacterium]|nr:hypothetical protein [Gemmatimonadota bacterium]